MIEVLFYLIPGYLLQKISDTDKINKNEDNWKLLLKIGVASLFLCYIYRER